MNSLNRMLALLGQTHLYNLSESSAITIEFKQYANYFDYIEIEIEALLDNCFVETIGPAGFDSYVNLYSLPESMDWDLMKEIVNNRLAITNLDFTIDGVKRCLASGGLETTLTEDFENNTVTVHVISDAGVFGSEQEKIAFIKQCMPCHVEPIIT